LPYFPGLSNKIGSTSFYRIASKEKVNLPYKDIGQQATQELTVSATTIPVLEYHKVDKSRSPTSTSPALFDAEMRYLGENGFTVLTMDDFGYDEENNYLVLNYPRTE
jgi:hypothetical protein